jgi:hypothetical protein
MFNGARMKIVLNQSSEESSQKVIKLSLPMICSPLPHSGTEFPHNRISEYSLRSYFRMSGQHLILARIPTKQQFSSNWNVATMWYGVFLKLNFVWFNYLLSVGVLNIKALCRKFELGDSIL